MPIIGKLLYSLYVSMLYLFMAIVIAFAFPFAIVVFGFFFAVTSMNSQTVKLYGDLPVEERQAILQELHRRKLYAILITLPPVLLIEWHWVPYLYSKLPFIS